MLRNRQAIPFTYIVSVTLTASATGAQSLTMASDSEFELHKINAFSTIDAVGNFQPNSFSVRIEDTSSGNLLSSARVRQALLAPRPTGGNRFARPILFPRNALLQFDYLETSGGTNTVEISLEGYKIFDVSLL